MQDRELYRQILGIEAHWLVEPVQLKLAEGEFGGDELAMSRMWSGL